MTVLVPITYCCCKDLFGPATLVQYSCPDIKHADEHRQDNSLIFPRETLNRSYNFKGNVDSLADLKELGPVKNMERIISSCARYSSHIQSVGLAQTQVQGLS